jgi:hypothetical protein
MSYLVNYKHFVSCFINHKHHIQFNWWAGQVGAVNGVNEGEPTHFSKLIYNKKESRYISLFCDIMWANNLLSLDSLFKNVNFYIFRDGKII